VSVILDAAALIAYERGSRSVQALLELAVRQAQPVRTTTAVVAQAWRDGSRQARLARLLHAVDEVALTPERARRIGRMLQAADTADVVDASVVELAVDGDEVLTSDPGDLRRLAEAAGRTLIITPVK
jgi:hypothetical protein